MYGLEAMEINPSMATTLDTFQLKCVSNNEHGDDTHTHTHTHTLVSNGDVRQSISNEFDEDRQKPMVTQAATHKRRRVAHRKDLMCAGPLGPGTAITFDVITLQLIYHSILRVCQPRVIWYKSTLDDLW